MSAQLIETNDGRLWNVRWFQATIYVPNSGETCDDVITSSNVTVTIVGGTVLAYIMTPSQIPPSGGLEVTDLNVLQTPGAASVTVTLASPSGTNSLTYDYPELINLNITPAGTSNISLCWNSRSNSTYQVQTCSDLTISDWGNIGGTISASNTNSCATNPVNAAYQYFRIQTVP